MISLLQYCPAGYRFKLYTFCIKKTPLNIKSKITIRNSGSAALDMAYVASGRYDAYFQKNLSLWDIAAGIIIVKEAGGYTNEIDLKKVKFT